MNIQKYWNKISEYSFWIRFVLWISTNIELRNMQFKDLNDKALGLVQKLLQGGAHFWGNEHRIKPGAEAAAKWCALNRLLNPRNDFQKRGMRCFWLFKNTKYAIQRSEGMMKDWIWWRSCCKVVFKSKEMSSGPDPVQKLLRNGALWDRSIHPRNNPQERGMRCLWLFKNTKYAT